MSPSYPDAKIRHFLKGEFVKLPSLVVVLLCAIQMGTFPSIASPLIKGATSMTVRYNKEGHKVNLANTPLYRQALTEFGKGQYGPSELHFEQLDKTGYCCDIVHYYIAQCNDNLNQTEAAEMNYQWVSAYSKDQTLVRYSIYGYEKLEYYNDHRDYAGQGNNFDRVKSSPVRMRTPPPPSYRFG